MVVVSMVAVVEVLVEELVGETFVPLMVGGGVTVPRDVTVVAVFVNGAHAARTTAPRTTSQRTESGYQDHLGVPIDALGRRIQQMSDNPKDPGGPAGEANTQPGFTTGFAWGVLLLFSGIALVAIFVVQNTNQIPVRFLWFEGLFPLSIIILVSAAAASLLTELGGAIYRRRRRKRIAEKEELRRLRAS